MSISTNDDDLGGTGTLGICVTLNDGKSYILSNFVLDELDIPQL